MRCEVESKAVRPQAVTGAKAKKNSIVAKIWRDRLTYLLLLPAFAFTVLFAYFPMYGTILAFKDYNFKGGIFGSPWAPNGGFYWFLKMFNDPEFLHVLVNTLQISFAKLIINTVACILFALLLNEVKHTFYKRTIQSIMYLPYFLSWVIMAGIIYNLLTSSGGVLNRLLMQINGGNKVQIISNPAYFRMEVYVSMVWKGVGFGSIIYLAAIAGVNTELYEAAIIDGANRLQRVLFVTLPCIKSTIILLLILDLGGIMNAGFDQIFSLYSPQVFTVGDILDTLIYRRGVTSGQFSFTTAVGLFKNVVNLVMLLLVNFGAKKLGEEGVI